MKNKLILILSLSLMISIVLFSSFALASDAFFPPVEEPIEDRVEILYESLKQDTQLW